MSSAHPDISIQVLDQRDLPAAIAIQMAVYPTFLIEDEAAFVSRIARPGACCLAAKEGADLLGYLLAHRWRRASPPSLGVLPPDAVPGEVLFIHDLAVAPAKRGLGVADRLIAHAFEWAARDGLRAAELVAVEGAAAYWRRRGFAEGGVSADVRNKLLPYGPHAQWMTRDIPSPR